MPNNTFRFGSDYTRDQGMNGCTEYRDLRNARHTGPQFRRDGTAYKFQALAKFDGAGAFDIQIFIDGRSVIAGQYRPSSNPEFVASNRFTLKHGLYSQHVWPYEMSSTGLRVLRAVE